jgi:hypothetical protein
VWDVTTNHHHIEPKRPMPYVNHYSFHILDPEWGHLTIKISGHPPFPAQVILNGHEYVGCQAAKAGIRFTKEGNCFTQISDAASLARIADTLSGQQAIGRLQSVCERWIYSSCLWPESACRCAFSRAFCKNLLNVMGSSVEACTRKKRCRAELNAGQGWCPP